MEAGWEDGAIVVGGADGDHLPTPAVLVHPSRRRGGEAPSSTHHHRQRRFWCCCPQRRRKRTATSPRPPPLPLSRYFPMLLSPPVFHSCPGSRSRSRYPRPIKIRIWCYEIRSIGYSDLNLDLIIQCPPKPVAQPATAYVASKMYS